MYQMKLEQLECLLSEDTPCRLVITHAIELYWIPSQKKAMSKLQILRICQNFCILNKLYTQHTSWSCLIRCANMKWIRRVLLKMQSGQDSVHRRTEGQTDGQGEISIAPFQLRLSRGYNKWPHLMRFNVYCNMPLNAHNPVSKQM